MAKQTSTRPTREAAPANVGSDALAVQAAEARNPELDDNGRKAQRQEKPVSAADRPYDRAVARRDASDTARKRHAKKTGGHLFPEVKPENGQIVMATKANRVGSPMFMAEYRQTTPTSPDGAFYSNSGGGYSMLEGTVDSWTDLPGE